MNVLKRMIIPRLDLTIRYILSELEEIEREDTFRLKRVKENKMKKVKGDGAGEEIQVTEEKEPRKEELSKPEAAKPVEEVTAPDESPIAAPPKEAAEMGDLIIIKPSDHRMELGDVYIPPPLLKTMATITEIEELIEGISDYDKKDISKETIDEIQKIPEQKIDDLVKDVTESNLETGEWFETPSKLNKPNLNLVPEYSKIDKHKDIEEIDGESNSTSADIVPVEADESILDLDKRALDSLYKSIDSNYYQPTIDDIFSKHDIAMKDSESTQDISVIEHSLVDLESIDFSIDSKGKVVASKSGQSTPALLMRPEIGLTASKSIAWNDKNEKLMSPVERQASIKWPDNRLLREKHLIVESNEELVKQILENGIIESLTLTNSEITRRSVTEINGAVNMQQNYVTNEFDESHESLSNKTLNPDDVVDKTDKLNNISVISLEETEVWTSDIEQIPKDNISHENEAESDANAKLEAKHSRSLSDVKLSLIREEEIVNIDTKSKLSTLVEDSKEKAIEEEKEGSIISDKFEDSISSFHNIDKSMTSKKQVSQSRISINDDNKQNLNNNDLETDIQENAESKMHDKINIQSNLKMDDVQENYFKEVTSARSSRDLNKIKQQNELNQHKIGTDKEELQENLSNINETHESSAEQPDGNSFTDKIVKEEDITDNINVPDAKTDLNRTEKEIAFKQNIKEKTLDSFQSTDNLRTEDNETNTNIKEQTYQEKNETESTIPHVKLKEYGENKPLRIKDSDETINTESYNIEEQVEQNSEIKSPTTNNETKRKSQENTKNEHIAKTSLKENDIKPLKIQNSNQIVRTNQNVTNSQTKQAEIDKVDSSDKELQSDREKSINTVPEKEGDKYNNKTSATEIDASSHKDPETDRERTYDTKPETDREGTNDTKLETDREGTNDKNPATERDERDANNGKEHKKDRDKNEEQHDTARSSDVSKRGKHSGDDHVKQE